MLITCSVLTFFALGLAICSANEGQPKSVDCAYFAVNSVFAKHPLLFKTSYLATSINIYSSNKFYDKTRVHSRPVWCVGQGCGRAVCVSVGPFCHLQHPAGHAWH